MIKVSDAVDMAIQLLTTSNQRDFGFVGTEITKEVSKQLGSNLISVKEYATIATIAVGFYYSDKIKNEESLK